jgi:hypothetical protein
MLQSIAELNYIIVIHYVLLKYVIYYWLQNNFCILINNVFIPKHTWIIRHWLDVSFTETATVVEIPLK